MIVRWITQLMMGIAGYKYEEPVPTFREQTRERARA
jgi:hypothetical protein